MAESEVLLTVDAQRHRGVVCEHRFVPGIDEEVHFGRGDVVSDTEYTFEGFVLGGKTARDSPLVTVKLARGDVGLGSMSSVVSEPKEEMDIPRWLSCYNHLFNDNGHQR
jgi:hypothetical protein